MGEGETVDGGNGQGTGGRGRGGGSQDEGGCPGYFSCAFSLVYFATSLNLSHSPSQPPTHSHTRMHFVSFSRTHTHTHKKKGVGAGDGHRDEGRGVCRIQKRGVVSPTGSESDSGRRLGSDKKLKSGTCRTSPASAGLAASLAAPPPPSSFSTGVSVLCAHALARFNYVLAVLSMHRTHDITHSRSTTPPNPLHTRNT